MAEEGSDLDLAPPLPSEDAEVNGTDEPTVEISVAEAEGNQHGNSDCDTECVPQDVNMLDGEICNQVESIKQLLLERSKDYTIPQLERLYTHIMKGIFETKSRAKVEDLKASILRFLFEFAEDQSRF